MKRITNYLSELVCQILGKKRSVTDGSSWIQKKILINRYYIYYGKKQNKLYERQPIINYYESN